MQRLFTALLGSLTALFPDEVIGVFETIAIGNPGECTTRPWISSMLRAEGVLIALASLSGGKPYAWLTNLTGAFGVVILLFPDLYRMVATRLLYERPENAEWNDQFTSGVRLVGVGYVLLAVSAFLKRRNRSDSLASENSTFQSSPPSKTK